MANCKQWLVCLFAVPIVACGPDDSASTYDFNSIVQALVGISDDFNDNSLDTATRWNSSASHPSCSVAETNGRLEVTCTSAQTSRYAQLVTKNTFDLTGEAVMVEVVSRGDQTSDRWEPNFHIFRDANNRLIMLLHLNQIYIRTYVNGTLVSRAQVAWDPAQPWLRIREQGGTIYYERSSDASVWQLLTSHAAPFSIASVQTYLEGGFWGGSATSSTVVFDNYNVPTASAPAVAITSPASGAYVTAANQSAFTVSGTCSEEGRAVSISGAATASATCTSATWSATLNLSGASDGTVTVHADHANASGTAATQASRNFTKDTVAPSVAITSPASGSAVTAANQSAYAVSGSCSENGRGVILSGAASATVTCNAGVWSATLNMSTAPEGSVTLSAAHTDAAGNSAPTYARSFFKDTTPAAVAIAFPADGAWVNQANQSAFTVSGSCSENGQAVSISGATTASTACVSGGWNVTLNFSGAPDGTVTVAVSHSDVYGNAATPSSRDFAKDSAAPTVAITSPASGSFITAMTQGAFAVSGSCSQDGRAVVVSGAGSASTLCSGAAWFASVDLSNAPDGSLVLTATHADEAGNSGASSRSYSKDSISPTLTLLSPADGTEITSANESAFVLTGGCSEGGQAVTLSGAASAVVTCIGGAWSASLNLTSAPAGTLTFYADHVDAAGNAAPRVTRAYLKNTSGSTIDAGAETPDAGVSDVDAGTDPSSPADHDGGTSSSPDSAAENPTGPRSLTIGCSSTSGFDTVAVVLATGILLNASARRRRRATPR